MARKNSRKSGRAANTLKDVGDMLASIRTKEGHSRREASELIGYSIAMIYQIEKGMIKPSSDYLAAFLALCDYCYGQVLAA